MTHQALRPVILAAMVAVSAAVPNLVHAEAGTRSPRYSAYRTGYGEPARRCDRAGVRDCQADATLHFQACSPFRGTLDCAGSALRDLRQCWAATGCW